MRDRKFEIDKQTSFAKNHKHLGSKSLLTDVDAIQSTENEFYNEDWYNNGQPIIRRFIEVKFKPSEYIKKQITRESELNSQTKMFSYLVYEINQFRKSNNIPLTEFYYVIQTNGDFPYYVYDVTGINSDLKFNYISKVEDLEQYIKVFSY